MPEQIMDRETRELDTCRSERKDDQIHGRVFACVREQHPGHLPMQHWESERPSWQSRVKNASRIEELRDCLLYMEESIKFDSAIMTWFRKRESWKRRVSDL
jgi:hypothetical protein